MCNTNRHNITHRCLGLGQEKLVNVGFTSFWQEQLSFALFETTVSIIQGLRYSSDTIEAYGNKRNPLFNRHAQPWKMSSQ